MQRPGRLKGAAPVDVPKYLRPESGHGYKGYNPSTEGKLPMSSIIEYLESEFATFDEKPFGAVDAAVLSQAAMLNGTGIVPSFPSAPSGLLDRLSAFLAPQLPSARFVDFARAERFDGMFTGLVPHDIKRCLFALIASPRFRDLAICGFQRVVDEAACTQFMATTYVWRDAFAFVAFGGTDISLAGWRENLDMAYCPETGAQRLARTYLEQAASHLPQRLLVGGHSKGGNLALYAALTCRDTVRGRIDHLWALDAPGFKEGCFTEEDYARLGDRASRIVPEESTIGMLLECPLEPMVVCSTASGVEQHSAFTWEIEGGAFVSAGRLSDSSRALRDVTAEWLSGMDDARRRRVVEAVSEAVVASGATDVLDVLAPGQDVIGNMIEVSQRLDADTRDTLARALGDLANIAMRRLGEDVVQSLPWLRRQ